VIFAEVESGDVFWSLIAFFFMVVYFMILFNILFDLFRDHGESGVKKALWLLLMFVFPLFGPLIYLIVRGGGMAQRSIDAQQAAQAKFDQYVQEQAGQGDPATQIEKAHALLDKGAISQEEFDSLKAKALASS
jgi:predicted PurR-regulated permease PerM